MARQRADPPHQLEPFFFDPPEDDFTLAALKQPHDLEALLRPLLYDEDLAVRLDGLIDDERGGTPEIPNWPRDPGRPSNYYRVCLVQATVVGRAFALLCEGLSTTSNVATSAMNRASQLPPELRSQVHSQYLANLAQRQRVWQVVSNTIAKGLFSSIEPEPAARYASAVILLTAGSAIRAWPFLTGKGRDWVPWMNHYHKAEDKWIWKDVRTTLMETEKLPRTNTHGGDAWRRASAAPDLWERQDDYLHVGPEVLTILDFTRAHIEGEGGDMSSHQIMDMFLNDLDPGQLETTPNDTLPGQGSES